MVIDYEKYPVLRMLKEEKLGKVGLCESDFGLYQSKTMEYVKTQFYKWSKLYKQGNCQLLSSQFNLAILKSSEKMMHDSIWKSDFTYCGTILNMPFGLSSMYYIKGNESGKHDFNIYIFQKDVFIAFLRQSVDKDYSFSWISNVLFEWDSFKKFSKNNDSDKREIINFLYSTLLCTLNFIKYADCETKNLEPKSKLKDIGCKYLNNTDTKIKLLNSLWFTNLIKSDAFKVSGHFRLQPCGEGLKDKKLIWVNEFQKEGYTRKAGILSEG